MTNISALIGSRICHDLINPLGAIGNGLELLDLAGTVATPELALITDSVENATAKVKFLRLAFGDANEDQYVPRREVLAVLDAMARGGRMSYLWDVNIDTSRRDVRVALLAVMCLETALPLGGDIEVRMTDNTWSVYTSHDRLSLDPALWVPMSKSTYPEGLTAAQVHFALLPAMAAEANRTLSLTHGADWVQISF